jgi:hypothetical protein
MIRRESSGHFESPSEKTILDVLGISWQDSQKKKRESNKMYDKQQSNNILRGEIMCFDNEESLPMMLIHNSN